MRLKNPIGTAKASLLFGRIFWQAEDVNTAQKFFEESIRLYHAFDIPLGLANCYLELSELLAEIGRKGESAEFREKAHAILDKLGRNPKPRKSPKKITVVTDDRNADGLEGASLQGA